MWQRNSSTIRFSWYVGFPQYISGQSIPLANNAANSLLTRRSIYTLYFGAFLESTKDYFKRYAARMYVQGILKNAL